METQIENDISVSISFKSHGINSILISYAFTTFVENLDEGFRCYIPGFDIYFFAATAEEGREIGIAMTRTFFNFWLEKKGKQIFFSELQKRGFSTTGDTSVMASLLKKNDMVSINHFRFTCGDIPRAFRAAPKLNEVANFSIAV